MDTLRGALECVDIKTGELHRPEHVQALIEGVARETLGVGECAKLAKYAIGRRVWCWPACCPARGVGRALVGAGGELGVPVLVLGQGAAQASCARPASCAYRHLLTAYGALQTDLARRMLSRRCCSDSASRGLIFVHKGATQGFLDLFRVRTRRWGRHKGTSAHECLTGPGPDWLTLLGCPPSPTLH